MVILFASTFSIFSFDDTFAQSAENESTREPFIKTDLDSFTPNLDIILFGNVGDLDLPITLEVSCDGIPDSIIYRRIFGGEHQSFQVDESGYFRFSLRTIEFTCDRQISTVTATIQGTNESTSFQIIERDENIKSTISASTDKISYQKGDSVIFSGKVTNYEFGKTVSYVMNDPNGYHISMSQSLLPNSDGIFSHTFESEWSLWRLDGNYEIKYRYSDDLSTKSQLTYYYSIPAPAEPIPEPEPFETPESNDEYEPIEIEVYQDNVDDETESYAIEEELEIQRKNIEVQSKTMSGTDSAITDKKLDSKDYSDVQDLVKQDKKIDVISKQLDSQTQHKVKSLDSKISREQSQYDEYLKQYDYYKGKILSSSDEQKFQRVIEKLNSQNEKVSSLIDERNIVVLQSDEITEIIEERVETPQPVRQVEEKPQKETFCFLFWCW